MSRVPYIGFSNTTLAQCPPLHSGESILCPRCGEAHLVSGPPDNPRSEEILFYDCAGSRYLAGVASKNVMGVEVDMSGEI